MVLELSHPLQLGALPSDGPAPDGLLALALRIYFFFVSSPVLSFCHLFISLIFSLFSSFSSFSSFYPLFGAVTVFSPGAILHQSPPALPLPPWHGLDTEGWISNPQRAIYENHS